MHHILILTLFLFSNQSSSQVNEENNITWIYDINEAKQIAQVKNLPILISFAGSDWCKPCIKFTKEVFETDDFSSFARENLVLVLADFPRNKKNRLSSQQIQHNEHLASDYNINGEFPLVVLIDHQGEIITTSGYMEGGPENFIAFLQKFVISNQ